MLIDTHCHLDFPDFSEDLSDVIARAKAAGVEQLITIGTTLESSRRAIELSEQYPEVYATVGVHPSNAMEAPADFVSSLREMAAHPRVVGLGEMGLDYHKLPGSEKPDLEKQAATALLYSRTEDLETVVEDGAIKARQAEVFSAQLELAKELGLPVVIHQRDCWEDILTQLAPYDHQVPGVFHCFGGDATDAKLLAERGYLVSFTGIVTFKNAERARDAVAAVPDDGFMVETDSPFLAPTPVRGKRCEPAYVVEVAKAIAETRGVSPERIAELTTATAQKFFKFPN